jgi:hypothetical protein
LDSEKRIKVQNKDENKVRKKKKTFETKINIKKQNKKKKNKNKKGIIEMRWKFQERKEEKTEEESNPLVVGKEFFLLWLR